MTPLNSTTNTILSVSAMLLTKSATVTLAQSQQMNSCMRQLMFIIYIFFVGNVLYDLSRCCQAVHVAVGNLKPCHRQYTNIIIIIIYYAEAAKQNQNNATYR